MSHVAGGYILLARALFESWLMDRPSLYMKLWVWMLSEANWKDHSKLKRGQFLTTIREMQEAMSYKVGFRKETPTIDQVRSAYEAFAKASMITAVKTTRGMIITILNYDRYQDVKSYEAHTDPHNETPMKPGVTPHYKGKKGEEGEVYSSTNVELPDSQAAEAPDEREGKGNLDSCPHQKIVDLYHQILPELRRVRSWNETRRSYLRARWREDVKRQSLDWWKGYFEYVRGCPWLMGIVDSSSGRKPFQADLEWLVRPQNFIKVVEGKYAQ